MTANAPSGQAEATAAAMANKSARTLYIEELERWVVGTQYDHLPDFFASDQPLVERAPCIVYPIARNAIRSFVDLILGETRWPTVRATVDNAETTDQAAGDTDSEASSEVDRAIVEAFRQTRFRSVSREALAQAMACRSAVAIFSVRKGRLSVDTTKAAWCKPELDDDGTVIRLEICYPYTAHTTDAKGRPCVAAKLYRRVIDATRDVTYKPADANKDGIAPNWSEDHERTREHGFGFCPVVWYPHLKSCSTVAEIDGHALHETVLDEIRALDMTLSQRHRAALYAGDPQWTECGVSPGHNPTEMGDEGSIPQTPRGGAPGATNPVTGHFREPPRGGSRQGRRKGPGFVWGYPDANTKVKLHTLPGDALKSLNEHARDLRIKLSESLSVMFMDPESVRYAAALSAKALETLRERQLNHCDLIRDDFGDRFIVPSTLMMFRVLRAIAAKAKVRFPRLAETIAATSTLEDADLNLHWPNYFRPDMEDEHKEAGTVREDLDAGIITLRTAVERRASRYGIEDVDAYMEKLHEEAERKDNALHAIAKRVLAPSDDTEDDDSEMDDGEMDDGEGETKPGARHPNEQRKAPEEEDD